jgi:hypothetical protein
MPTVRAAGAGKAVGENAALEVTTKFPFHVGRHALPVPVILPGEREVGLQVLLDDLVQGGLLRTATAVRDWPASRWLGGHAGIRLAARSWADFMYSIAMIPWSASR